METARSAFRMFAVLIVVAAILATGRVWLSVQAAEASLEANRLRNDIKTERYEGDMLEVRQSALGSPSRIRAIAGQAMDMAPARKVTYLEMKQSSGSTQPSAGSAVPAGDDRRGEAATGDEGLGSMIGEALRLSMGEAQVLLVGDVGLASAR